VITRVGSGPKKVFDANLREEGFENIFKIFAEKNPYRKNFLEMIINQVH